MLTDKKILLIIGGGIAAFRSLDLMRRLRERGASVTPVLTPASRLSRLRKSTAICSI